MYTLPAEVMPTLQAHRACEHTVLAQDAGNFHDLEKLHNPLIFRKFLVDSQCQSKSAKQSKTETEICMLQLLAEQSMTKLSDEC